MKANLGGSRNWTIETLEQARDLRGAIMPDEVRLSLEGTRYRETVKAPSFQEWKAQYLDRVDISVQPNK
jgi:hypothetical protein